MLRTPTSQGGDGKETYYIIAHGERTPGTIGRGNTGIEASSCSSTDPLTSAEKGFLLTSLVTASSGEQISCKVPRRTDARRGRYTAHYATVMFPEGDVLYRHSREQLVPVAHVSFGNHLPNRIG